MFLVASKIDVAQDPTRVEALKNLAAEKELPFFAISAVTGQGLDALKRALAERLLG
jgi:GTP-binding protein